MTNKYFLCIVDLEMLLGQKFRSHLQNGGALSFFFSFKATLKLHSETMTQQKETISKLEERDREREDELRDAKEKVAALTTLVEEKVS